MPPRSGPVTHNSTTSHTPAVNSEGNADAASVATPAQVEQGLPEEQAMSDIDALLAPGLDIVVGYFTALPLILGPVFGGWIGLGASVLAQVLAVMIWTTLHGLAHPQARKGPRIVKFLNALVGPWRNFLAVWITAFAVPVFICVRAAELLVYPFLVWLIRFPKYKQSEWVRVGRYKFENLVGHDLIWCLYCDWMTGVWSLGSEMLRNVESFWCPIRFDNKKKCSNCSVDFPDVFNGWANADGSM